ncbi:MAG: FG-GAP-like repeat-containing protein [Gemmataceae bacterium]
MARRSFDFVRLEERNAPAVFTVTTTADTPVGGNNSDGSLRAAINNANLTPGQDTINFNIPGTGISKISLVGPLPSINEGVTIDATTQPGYSGTPVVELNGSGITQAVTNGFLILNASNVTIRGFIINNFKGSGIKISGGSNNVIVGNLIGLNSAGTAASANGYGIILANSTISNTIGGTSTSDANVISGNTNSGIRIDLSSSSNTVSGNFIGTGVSGSTAVPNGADGIHILGGSTGNTIGGNVAGSGNIIAGNSGNGIQINDPNTAANIITGNRIGVGFNGVGLANALDGIRAANAAGSNPTGGITQANANLISKNTITSNTGNGIAVLDTSRSIRIESNSITSNGQLGIQVDATANQGLPAPTLTSVTGSTSGITVQGTVTAAANRTIRVEIFGNTVADPSGFGEGATSLGSTTVTTDSNGSATFSMDVAVANVVSATAEDTTTGDSSAFSKSMQQTSPPPPTQFMNRYAVGTGSGVQGQVNVYSPLGVLLYSLTPYGTSYTNGVRVAMADVNGDGALDVIVGSGPGVSSQVKVYDGKSQQVLYTVLPFESSFLGGVFVSGGDINGDGKSEIVISPDEGGGPRVRIFSGADFTQLADFFGIADPNFRGGARTAVGDLNNDGKADLVVAAGFGGGPRVSVYSGATLTSTGGTQLFGDFFAFEQTLRNGTYVAAGDINGDGFADLIVGGGPGGGPRVEAFSGKDLVQSAGKQTVLVNYFAGDTNSRGGVRIASRLITGDGLADIIAGPGDGSTNVVGMYAGSSLMGGSSTPGITITPFGSIVDGVYVG